MSDDRHSHLVERLVDDALARPAEQWPMFLERACHGDADLRLAVESLLSRSTDAERFLESGAGALAHRVLATPAGTLAGQQIGAFAVERLIGAGGMGEVYLARDTALGRLVALKVLPPDVAGDEDRVTRFQREARLLASLNHPHIAGIHGLEHVDGALVLVLEYVAGTTLSERLHQSAVEDSIRGDSGVSPRVTLDESLRLAHDIADALHAAHRSGVVHRDLKPANVMVTATGAKLLDFGLGAIVDAQRGGVMSPVSAIARDRLSDRGSLLGTVPYMAPEQLRGGPVDHRCDIFAFGVVLYEMVAGCHPFAAATDAGTIAAILERGPASPTTWRDDLPLQLERLILKCLEKDPDTRWQSAGDIVEVLKWIHDSSAAISPRSVASTDLRGPSSSAASGGRRISRRLALLGAGLALAVAAFAFGTTWRPAGRADRASLSFVIPPAPGTVWETLPVSPNPAVSPNGRYVALFSRSEGGTGLWMHDLETGEARLLAPVGSDTPPPFWSPDSTSVAYCDSGGVRVVPLDSRPSQVTPAPNCGPGSWHATGGWLLTTESGLVRMPGTVGTPTHVTTVEVARGEIGHVLGKWLPDGRHFVFLIRAQTPDSRGIYLGSIDNPQPRRLLADYSVPSYVSEGDGTGLLLFVRGSTLVAQEFDERSLSLGKGLFVVGQQVRVGITARSGSFDASNRLLVYRSGGAYQPTHLVWVDRNGRQIAEVGPDLAYRLSPSLSPDERTLYYGRYNDATNWIELWSTDLKRGVSAPVYKPDFSVESPLPSPDGRMLAYMSAERGIFLPWTIDAKGKKRQVASNSISTVLLDLEWTPDSVYLLARVAGAVRGFAADGSGKSINVLNRSVIPRVSPDGQWLAYAAEDTGSPEVYIERFGGSGRLRVSGDGGFSPRWRGDGRELYFRAAPDRLMAVDVRLGDNPVIGRPHILFRGPFEPSTLATAATSDYVVTKDGRRFLITVPVRSTKPLTARLNWLAHLREDRTESAIPSQ